MADPRNPLTQNVLPAGREDAANDVRAHARGGESIRWQRHAAVAELIVEHARLFHGSGTPGITKLQRAEETTVGEGVYLADEPTARAYAQDRARNSRTPIVYEVEVPHARLVDLTDQATVVDVMTGFRQVLANERERASQAGSKWNWQLAIDQMIQDIDNGGMQVGRTKIVTRRSGGMFTDYLQQRGFDGVHALEGGGNKIGVHHTYLVFEPDGLHITSEERLASTAPHDNVAVTTGHGVATHARSAPESGDPAAGSVLRAPGSEVSVSSTFEPATELGCSGTALGAAHPVSRVLEAAGLAGAETPTDENLSAEAPHEVAVSVETPDFDVGL